MQITLKELQTNPNNYTLIDIYMFSGNHFLIDYKNKQNNKNCWIKASAKTLKSLNLGNLKSVGNGFYRPTNLN